METSEPNGEDMRAKLLFVSTLGFLVMVSTALSFALIKTKQYDELGEVRRVLCETAPDPQVEIAIPQAYYRSDDLKERVRYYYNKVDLDGDGHPEILVQLRGDSVCGSGGCDTFVLQASNKGYRIVSDIALTRTPVIVSPQKTRGWNDLIVYVAGGGITHGYYVMLQFDGRTYPRNPTLNSRFTGRIVGTAYLADADVSAGIILQRGK